MNEKKSNEDNEILGALNLVEIEKKNLYKFLKEIIETRKSLEIDLNSVENKVASVVQETYYLQSINAQHIFKLHLMDKEVNQLGAIQNELSLKIENLEKHIKERKQNFDIKINDFTRKSDNICELFMFAVHIEATEFDNMKISEDINKLKSACQEKEADLFKLKKELEEFAFCEIPKKQLEYLLSLEERQVMMDILEEQLLHAKKVRQTLENTKAEKQVQEIELARKI